MRGKSAEASRLDDAIVHGDGDRVYEAALAVIAANDEEAGADAFFTCAVYGKAAAIEALAQAGLKPRSKVYGLVESALSRGHADCVLPLLECGATLSSCALEKAVEIPDPQLVACMLDIAGMPEGGASMAVRSAAISGSHDCADVVIHHPTVANEQRPVLASEFATFCLRFGNARGAHEAARMGAKLRHMSTYGYTQSLTAARVHDAYFAFYTHPNVMAQGQYDDALRQIAIKSPELITRIRECGQLDAAVADLRESMVLP